MIVIYIYKKHFFINKVLGTKTKNIYDLIEEKDKHYFNKTIQKKNGVRELKCLKEGDFKHIQQNLKKNFLDELPIPDYVYGFVKSSSYKDFLLPHIGKMYYVRLDIKDFFPSVKRDLLFQAFKGYFKLDGSDNDDVLNLFVDIVTLNEELPQGAVTSPVISNIVFRSLDIRIKYYCDKLGITYTRYADDLLFSSTNEQLHSRYFIKKVSKILGDKKFKLNTEKTLKYKEEISLNGFVVGKKVRLSRKRKSDLAQVIRLCRNVTKQMDFDTLLSQLNQLDLKYRKKTVLDNGEEVYFSSKETLANYLLGFRSFFIDWLNTNLISDKRDIKFFIDQIETFIDKHYAI